MRSISIIGMIIFMAAGCKNNHNAHPDYSHLDSTQLTTIEWLDSTNKNFGKITEGQKLQVTFRFRNSGQKPLVIQRVQASCGCTIAEQPEAPVAPGQEDQIKASFNSEGRTGINHKTLTVYANTVGSTTQDLRFEVAVEKKKW